jgi:ATP-dependent protease ClpP protease subunit
MANSYLTEKKVDILKELSSQKQEGEALPLVPTPTEIAAPRIQYIWCSAAISKKLEDTLCQFIIGQLQNGPQITEYVFYISTLGGDPYAGVNLYSFLKSLPIKTTAYNMGITASAGVPFFLGFKNRYGTPNCSFMIHQTMTSRNTFPENVNMFDLQTQMQLLEATDKKTIGIIESETKVKATTALTKRQIETDVERSHTYQAEDALKYGFIEKIEQPEISKTDILYVTDQWLAKQA